MKPKKIFFLIILFFNINCVQQKFVRGSSGWGFYAEFLWVINHLQYCITQNKIPVIYWGPSFAYYTPNGFAGSYNAWEYYFEAVSNLSYDPSDPLTTQLFYHDNSNFSSLWNYDQYIDNLHLLVPLPGNKIERVTHGNFPRGNPYQVGNQHLYNESFRSYVKENILNRFIKFKEKITTKVELFYNEQMRGKKTIGIHLRGQFLWGEVPMVANSYLFAEANKYADGKTQFFIATDQWPLLEDAKKQLKGKVIFFDCTRFDHSTAPVAGGTKLDPVLGENVLIEMLLLSHCDYFIHTISNVSTTALYFNPTLKHTVLY